MRFYTVESFLTKIVLYFAGILFCSISGYAEFNKHICKELMPFVYIFSYRLAFLRESDESIIVTIYIAVCLKLFECYAYTWFWKTEVIDDIYFADLAF